jgi:hypothetical protein
MTGAWGLIIYVCEYIRYSVFVKWRTSSPSRSFHHPSLPASLSRSVLLCRPVSFAVFSPFLCPVQQVRHTHAAIVPRRQGTTFINGRMSSLYKKSGRYQFVYNFIHICQHGILLTGHKCVTYKKSFLGDFLCMGDGLGLLFLNCHV